MYGHIHKVIKDLVLSAFGQEQWDKILKEVGLNDTDHFLQFDYFSDSTTVNLIMAVSKCLNLPVSTVLETFGDYFLRHCLAHGYDNMLRTLGRDMKSFIQNLDSLHALLTLSYDKLVAPSFRCESAADGSLILHYYSCRQGLSDIVKGVVRAVGSEIFQQNVRLVMVCSEQNDLGGGKSQEHTVFKVLFQDDNKIDDGKVVRETDNGTRAISSLVFKLVYPRITLNIDNIRRFTNTIFVLTLFPKNGRTTTMSVKGQMLLLEEGHQVLFVGSPCLKSLKEMKEMDVYMADIPLFDVTREIVLLYEQRNAEIDITRKLDLTTAELKRTSLALEKERRKTEQLLHQMLPPKVANQLKNGEKVEAETFKSATIMFSDVVTFTNIASACSPEKIVNMLNDMYERFDRATNRWDVYKVETIGDAYMVVGGVPVPTADHAERVARFAMDIVGEAANVPSPATGKPLQIRVGIHTGSVMAGVVGIKMPRYCLFGDTVNTASRMESHGVPGRIHLSPAVFGILCTSGFQFKLRGEMDIKGKGLMVTHFLIGDGERSISEPLDNYTDHPVLSSLVPDGNDHCECTNKMSSDINKNGEFKIPSDPANTISTPNDTKNGNGVDSVCSRVLKPDYSFLHDPDSGGARERFGSPIGPNVVSCMSPLATGPRIHSSKSCSVL